MTVAVHSAVQMAPFPCQPTSEGVQWDDSLFGVAIQADAPCAYPSWPRKQATSYLTNDILGLNEHQSCIRKIRRARTGAKQAGCVDSVRSSQEVGWKALTPIPEEAE